MMPSTTLKTLILEELEKCDHPVSPKRMRTLLLANQRRQTTASAIGVYLSRMQRDGEVRRLWAGGYVHLDWTPPVADDKDYLRPWLKQWFLDHPLTGFTRKQLEDDHEEQWGTRVVPAILDIQLRHLKDSGVLDHAKGVWMKAPESPRSPFFDQTPNPFE